MQAFASWCHGLEAGSGSKEDLKAHITCLQ
jgi:hypothetical protein